MKWYCPYCWKPIDKDTTQCSHCGHNLSEFEKISYEDKLILALKNPIREYRMFSIYMLGQIGSTKAIKHLCELSQLSADTIELLYIAKTLKYINTQESLNCLHQLREKNNALLNNFINKLEAKDGD